MLACRGTPVMVWGEKICLAPASPPTGLVLPAPYARPKSITRTRPVVAEGKRLSA